MGYWVHPKLEVSKGQRWYLPQCHQEEWFHVESVSSKREELAKVGFRAFSSYHHQLNDIYTGDTGLANGLLSLIYPFPKTSLILYFWFLIKPSTFDVSVWYQAWVRFTTHCQGGLLWRKIRRYCPLQDHEDGFDHGKRRKKKQPPFLSISPIVQWNGNDSPATCDFIINIKWSRFDLNTIKCSFFFLGFHAFSLYVRLCEIYTSDEVPYFPLSMISILSLFCHSIVYFSSFSSFLSHLFYILFSPLFQLHYTVNTISHFMYAFPKI